MNIHDNRRRFQNSQLDLARLAMTATRSATDFEIMQQEHIEQMRTEIERLNKNLRLLLCKTHFDKCEAGLFNSKNPDDEPCLICLMNAAERGEGL